MAEDVKFDFDKYEQQFAEDVQNEEHATVLITGKSGVGKSTLINAVFGENVVETGTGKPVTQQTQLFESAKSAIRIYDTKGFEISGSEEIADEIINLVTGKKNSLNPDDMIGVIWYAIAANAGRIEEAEINFIKSLLESDIDVPVIIVLTKSDNRAEFIPLRDAIYKENTGASDVIPVLAETVNITHPASDEIIGTVEPYGLEELTDKTYDVLPDLQKIAFANQQLVNKQLKEKIDLQNKSRARTVIITSVAAAFAEGFIPIPFADSATMIPTQIGMIAGINAVYHLDLKKSAVIKLATTLTSTQAAVFGGREATSNLLKFIPVVGSVAGGVISGTTGALMTSAMGLGYLELISMSQTQEWEDMTFEEFLKSVDIKKVMNNIDIDAVKSMVSNAKIKNQDAE